MLCLLKPRPEVLLSHPQVLDMRGGTIQENNLDRL
jgi:hypothetical protein